MMSDFKRDKINVMLSRVCQRAGVFVHTHDDREGNFCIQIAGHHLVVSSEEVKIENVRRWARTTVREIAQNIGDVD